MSKVLLKTSSPLRPGKLSLFKPGFDLVVDRKAGRKVRLLGAGANNFRIGASAEKELKCVNKDRFAAAGLTGQCSKTV